MKNLNNIVGFLPLMGMIFVNNFIDLGHKIIIQNTVFKIYNGSEQIILTAIVNGLVLLPHIFFFYSAGKASDRYPKANVMRFAALAALCITSCISFCYFKGWFWAAFGLIFVLAIQSAYYGPAKYGLLKQLVDNQQLSSANGIAQTLSIIGILSGLLCFSIFYELRFTQDVMTEKAIIQLMAPLSFVLIFCSCIECYLAWKLPIFEALPQPIKPLITEKNWTQSPILFPSMIGLAIFWSVGQMLIATYPAFAKEEMGVTNTIVIQGLLATIAIGIMVGSYIAGKYSKTHIETALIPLGFIGIILTTSLLPFVTNLLPSTFLFFIIGVFGGIFIVPLNAIIQYCTPPEELGSTISKSILMQNIFMASCLVLTVIAALFNITAKNILFIIALISCFGLVIFIFKMPQVFARFTSFYKKPLLVKGFNNISGHGPLLIIHNSFDPKYVPLLQIAYPRKITFAEIQKWDENTCCCVEEGTLFAMNYTENFRLVYAEFEEKENHIELEFLTTPNKINHGLNFNA